MISLSGSVTDAFTHFYVGGLASIIDSRVSESVIVHWIDSETASLELHGGNLDLATAAGLVHTHAREHAENSWVTEVKDLSFSGQRAPMSPRLGRPESPADWAQLQQARFDAIEGLSNTASDVLDWRLLGALGEPAYWCIDGTGKFDVDQGASPLEMKARNNGQDFVRNRLSLLASAVATRSVEEVAEGMDGTIVRDEVGSGALNSRTPTGLRAPSLTDNAQAWCALWGLSLLPVRPVVMNHSPGRVQGARSLTSAVVTSKSGPRLVLPVPDRPLSLGRLRSIMVGSALTAAISAGSGPDDARRKLASQGVDLIVVFERHVTDNANAPERWLRAGNLIELSAPRDS
jgi:CRISPR-associated protein Csb3